MKKLTILTAITALLCASGFLYLEFTKDPLVGNWGKRTVGINFMKDGTMSVDTFGVETSGTWSRIDDNRINLKRVINNVPVEREFTVDITGETLTMVSFTPEAGQETITLQRDYTGPTIAPSELENISRVQADIRVITMQLRSYESMNDSLPTTEQGLVALVRMPKKEPLPENWMKLYRHDPVDPWSQPYRYRINNPEDKGRSGTEFDLWSAGIDGKDGTDDDIGNWQ